MAVKGFIVSKKREGETHKRDYVGVQIVSSISHFISKSRDHVRFGLKITRSF